MVLESMVFRFVCFWMFDALKVEMGVSGCVSTKVSNVNGKENRRCTSRPLCALVGYSLDQRFLDP